MNAIVLVGGEGTRLRPLTLTTPKQLLPVAGVPMIERVLGSLARHGVEQAVLSLGHRPDAFLSAFPGDVVAGMRLSYAVEPKPLDTAGAIRFAAEEAKLTDTFVVVNGDVLTDIDLSALVAFHRTRRALATIALVPVEDPSRFGVVPTDTRGRVTAFVEKPPPGSAPTNAINAGTYVLEPEVLDRIPAGRPVSIERETFPALVAQSALYALVLEEYWLDTGTPAAYLQANADLVSGRRGLPPAPGARPAAEGGPGVWVLGSPVLAGHVEGPSLVGDGAELREGSLVRASVVAGKVVVHSAARVENSVVLEGAVVGEGARVRNSIVGARARIGTGAVLEDRSVVGDGALVEAGVHVVEGRIGPGSG